MKNWPKVFVIILNWNYYQDTIACLRSLQKVHYSNMHVVVVDNGSENESVTVLKREFPEVTILVSEENVGFAAGSNIGIRYALRHSADYVLLLNNDTEVDENFLKPMVEVAEADEKIGIVGGKIYYFHSKHKMWSTGGYINLLKGRGIHVALNRFDDGCFNKGHYVGFVSGCLMLIKRAVLENCGLLPDEYFFGVEEWDYSFRVDKLGYKLYYCPQAVIWHKVGASHQRFAPKYIYNAYRNKLLFMKRNLKRPLWYIWYLIFWIYSKTWLLPRLSTMAKMEGSTDYDKVKTPLALKAALRDGWRKDRITWEDLEAWG